MRTRFSFFAALFCAFAVAACGGSSKRATTPHVTPTTPISTATTSGPAAHVAGANAARCSSSQLRLGYVRTGAATGHVEVTFALHNKSANPCTLFGYPGAQLLNSSGHLVTTHLTRGNGFFPDTQAAPRRVLLEPGGRALFGLSFSDNNEYAGQRSCPAGTTLLSVPPNAFTALRLDLAHAGPASIAPCGGRLTVSPVYADAVKR